MERDKQAFNVLKNILEVSPLNTSKVYCQLKLKSDCLLYVPIAPPLVEKAQSIKDQLQIIVDAAGI